MAQIDPRVRKSLAALNYVTIISGLGLMAGKGLGLGVNWLTIFGVFAIPGFIAAIGLVLVVLIGTVVGVASIMSNSSK